MRLTASILEDYPMCGFKTKLRYFDREEVPLTNEDIGAIYLGRLAHAGQDAYLGAGCPEDLLMVGPAVCAAAEKELRSRIPPEQVATLVLRACAMVKRWAEFHNPRRFQEYAGGWVNRRMILPLEPHIGAFTEYVIQPDRVSADHRGPTLWDWKWTNKLMSEEDEREALRFDVQSVVYQHGLHQLGFPVYEVGHVRGLRAEPTAFRANKDGRISTRPIRNSPEAYRAACALAGQEPNPDFEAKLLPFFREPTIYRSAAEVKDLWNAVVVPRALEISRSIALGFTRRMSRFACLRCPYSGLCWESARGRGEPGSAFSSPFIVGPRGASAPITAADLS